MLFSYLPSAFVCFARSLVTDVVTGASRDLLDSWPLQRLRLRLVMVA